MGGGQTKLEANVPHLESIFTIGKELGHGAFGHVFKVYYKEDVKQQYPYALKLLDIGYSDDIDRENEMKTIKEYNILKIVAANNECKNIVCPKSFIKLLYKYPPEFINKKIQLIRNLDKREDIVKKMSEDRIHSALLMDYVDGITISAAIEKLAKSNKDMGKSLDGNDTEETCMYLGEVLHIEKRDYKILNKLIDDAENVIKVLQKYNIAHGDLQTHNIMITYDTGDLKLIDFSGCITTEDKDCDNQYELYDIFSESIKPLIQHSILSGNDRKKLIDRLKVAKSRPFRQY